MYKSKLLVLLKSLNKKEMTHFVDFVHSPYFNKHQDVQQLCNYLQSCYPQFTEKKCERTLIFKKIYGGKVKFDQKKLNLIFTYTLRLLEQFFIVEQLKEESYTENLLLLKNLRNKEQFAYWDKKMKRFRTSILEETVKDSRYYLGQYSLANEADEYHAHQAKHQQDQNIQEKQNSLDVFFISEKLRDACEMLVRNRLLKVDYSIQLLSQVEELLEANLLIYQDKPPILVYRQLYKMLITDEEEHYYHFVEILEDKIEYFGALEQKSLYDYAQNFCVSRINKKGQANFLKEYFKLNEAQLKKGLLLQSGYLLEWHYKNLVTVGLRLQEYDWVQNFIEEYKDKLHEDARDNAYRYNLAAYCYETKQYKEVLNLLRQVEFSDIRYSTGAKSILLRTFYDLEEYEALNAHCHAFKVYINRNKLIADQRKKGFYMLIKFAKKLAQLKGSEKVMPAKQLKDQLAKLQREIEETEPIFNKKWVLEKVKGF